MGLPYRKRADGADEAVAQQAAEWIVRLTGDDVADRERARAAFEAWKQADVRHAQAAAPIAHLIEQMRDMREGIPRSSPARAALQAAFPAGRKRSRSKRAVSTFLVAAALIVPGWLTMRTYPAEYLTADIRSGVGEWQTRLLPDGTRVALASASAINLRYDEGRRALELIQGEILVDVAPESGRPFVVETDHGTITALGTRFVVNRLGDATELSMIESRVSVLTARQRVSRVDRAGATLVTTGQRVRISPDEVSLIGPVEPRSLADAWKFRQLVVQDAPLAEVLEALARHRRGHIHYRQAALADIRVSAVLPLDDTDRALQLLMTGFPQLRVRQVTPYLVLVDATAPPTH